ncbi:MAG: hypothetical protein K5989_02225 [Lachnospiraceae bacterium]|nr:hypothetical protein [Lachnospiraceae bacterium]
MGHNFEDLLTRIEDKEFEEWIRSRNGKFRFIVYPEKRDMEKDIDALDLSMRSYNCLKRAGYATIKELIAALTHGESLMNVRNLGKKSADEIMFKLFLYNYGSVSQERRGAYFEKVKKINTSPHPDELLVR